LFRWKGSVYKAIWFEFIVFSLLYTTISLIYRLALDMNAREKFEHLCLRCDHVCELLPVVFVLGFYVNTIVKRWWEQFCEIPWPDTLTLLINAYAQSTTERARMQRRTFIRYINLSFCLTTRDVSSRARMRFPTLGHLISAGLITPDELRLYEESATDNMPPINFLPLCWAQELVTEMYKEKNIVFDRAVELLTAELGAYRDKLYKLVIYDWINVPLVYTQVTKIYIFIYFKWQAF
uniref:Bestrophin homolog n=1 Tax=Rodentolepis nana TaxID=102285 RepID=A0A0R3TCE2_RODNA